MVLGIYKRFSESTNFCSKERWLRPVAMMLGHVKNRQPVLFHGHPGQRLSPGGGTPNDDQCTMLGGLDPHFRAWLDLIGSIFDLGSIP